MKFRFQFFAMAALFLGIAACSDLKDIEDRLDSLESRIEAIENILPTLNSNIEALQKLANGATINSVEELDGTYRVILTNGDTLTLTQGSIGVGKAPVMSIDKDGYWMVNYGDGAEYLMNGEEKVRAESLTPKFSVDEQGYWLVSYDGETYTQVKDENGQSVSATPEIGDAFFKKVEIKGDTFVVTTADGSELKLPIVPDFMFAIKREATGIITLLYDEPVTYPIESKGVASVAVVSCPSNVEVNVNETSLTIEAVFNKTKAAADTRKDIAILAVSEKGFATIAKLEVKVDENSRPSTTPKGFVNLESSALKSLTYAVKVKNTTTFKYIHQLASAAVPSEDAFVESKTIATDEWYNMTFEGLEMDTEYTLYVLPVLLDNQTLNPGEKITMVYTEGAKTLAPAPNAEVTEGAKTYKSLTFNVTLNEEADSYKYRLYAEGETPSLEWAKDEEPVAELTFNDLKADKNYFLEVVALNGERYESEVVTTMTKTVKPADYYEMYDAGYDITIGNKLTINKETYPSGVLITSASNTKNLKQGLYFVDSDAGCSIGSGLSDLIIIGRSFTQPTKLSRAGVSYITGTTSETDRLILKNISDEGISDKNNFELNQTAMFEAVIFDGCNFGIANGKSLISHGGSNGRNLNDITIVNCNININTKGTLVTSRNTPIKSVELKNNVIYSNQESMLSIVDYAGANNTDFSSIEISHNTFYNTISFGATQGYIRAQSVNSLSVTDNLFYDCAGSSYHTYVYYNTVPVTSPSASNNINSEDKEVNDDDKEIQKRVYIVNSSEASPLPDTVTQPTAVTFDFSLDKWDPANYSFKIDGTYQNYYYGATR